MIETSARLLELLSLLQSRREWSGAELAERLDVGARTVRRDVERLRRLGYPVQATPGVAGGYRLGAGATLPPLLLDQEEAVAVAVGLRTAASAGVEGIEETSVRALAKLEQLLPTATRRRVAALGAATVPYPGSGPLVDPEVLATIAAASRDRQRLRFSYRDHRGEPSRRLVGAAPPRAHRQALVPGRVGRAARGLADVPRRPHRAAAVAGRALRAARAARGGHRGVRRRLDLLHARSPPGAGDPARVRRRACRARAAPVRDARADRRAQLPAAHELRLARRPRDLHRRHRRRLRGARATGARRGGALAGRALHAGIAGRALHAGIAGRASTVRRSPSARARTQGASERARCGGECRACQLAATGSGSGSRAPASAS